MHHRFRANRLIRNGLRNLPAYCSGAYFEQPTVDLGRKATAQKIAKITKNGRLSVGLSS